MIDIRKLYVPVQPTIKKSAEDVAYSEFLADNRLQDFICCYWELKTTKLLQEQFNYRVVADGCIDIFFALDKPAENFVMGFCKKYSEFPLGSSFHYVGIRFLPTAFPQIFNIDATELSNRFENLSLVAPATAQFITDNLNIQQSQAHIKTLFDEYFLELLSKMDFNKDNRLYAAIDIILKNFGVLNVETDLNTGVSPRQLRRLFKFYIGDTAKTFSKVIRFQNILKAKPSTKSLRESKIFFDGGYYDQAHFIKEFKRFYGISPSKAFGK